MTDCFKKFLSQINNIMWATLSLSVSLLILDPSARSITVFGFTANGPRLLSVVPIALVGLLLAKQIVIRNAIDIVQRSKNKSELKEIVLSYPLIEFMRWKFTSNLESILLTAFQVVVDIFPAISLIIFWYILTGQSIPIPIIYEGSALLLIFLSIWNYASLRYRVFEPLAGKIKTPD